MKKRTLMLLWITLGCNAPGWAQTQYHSVKANVQCRNPTSGTIAKLEGVTVRLKSFGTPEPTGKTATNGDVTLKYSAYDLAPALEVIYNGNIKTTVNMGKVLSSKLQVLHDGYTPRSDMLRPLAVAGKINGDVLERGILEVSSIDCVIWSLSTEVLTDYHTRIEQVPEAGGYRLLRRVGTLPEIPWTSYDTVELSNELSAIDSCTIYHEFGHSVRHVIDGSQKHFADDVFKYIYGQEHSGNGITNVQHAFNEGWADYWEQRKGCPGAIAAGDRDWHEGNVAARLMELSKVINASGIQIGEKGLVTLLQENRGSIHSLHQFEIALKKKYPAAPDPVPVSKCPANYKNDGAFCRLDLTQPKPNRLRGAGTPLNSCAAGSERSGLLCYPLCPPGYRGAGPVCWQICRNGYSDDGATCRRGLDIYLKKSQGRGAGSPLTCGPGREKDGALCYSPCPVGFTGRGPVCWGACPPGTRDDGAICGKVHSIVIADF